MSGRPLNPDDHRSLVVGAAIVRHGCVLAARRTTPPEAAGRWEFPGGKVEPVETPEHAIVREIGEELGCVIRVERWLDGAAAIGDTHVLRVAVATVEDGDPAVVDHDDLRWLTPELLHDVDWLGPDRPFLPRLKEVLLDGERLPGGNVGGAVRIGDTVRRATGPWTPSVHSFLAHLQAAGLRCVPRVHGYDERGREILDYLPGEVIDVDTEVLSEPRLADLGRWAREFHDASRGFEHPGPWRFEVVGAADLVIHNDLAPYNVAFDGDRVAAVFDWDLAVPSTVLRELGHLAWVACPLVRPIPTPEAAHRLRVLAAAYGGPSAAEILASVAPRVQLGIDGIRTELATGDGSFEQLRALGEPERTEGWLDAFRERLPELEAALAAP